ncbi:MAG TPA: ProQ/FINO family protein [Pseudomonadales bacterium]
MNEPKPVLTLKRPRREPKRPTVKASTPVTPKSAAMAKAVAKAKSAASAKVVQAPVFKTVSDERFLAELQGEAPDLWNPDKPVPLAIGIHKQLYPVAERLHVSRRFLRRFLARWTAMPSYQRAMSEPGAMRLNLDGSPAGEVSEVHGERARKRVAPEH